MSKQNVDKPPVTEPRISGVRTVLRYTGIPTSWLDKRPKLPSRNWLIFIGLISSITGYYIHDRRQCRKIRQEYVDKVKEFSELPSSPLDKPRKVVVYGSKWPGDEDYDQSLRYFRKYVKPILVAAAVDYEMIGSKRLGELSDRVANDVRRRRRLDLGIDKESEATKALPTYEPFSQARQRELDGGIIIVGRPTWKEFMHGLRRGWTEGLQKVDEDEMLARELEDDGAFDELEELEADAESSENARPRSVIQQKPSIYSPIQFPSPMRLHQPGLPSTSSEALSVTPPSEIPPLPPILLVPFTDHIGFGQIPLMIWDFFNQRHKVRSGSEAAYNLIMKNTRPIVAPPDELKFTDNEDRTDGVQGDLNFDKQADAYIKKSLNDIPKDIEKARKKYYEELPKKLETARALARGTREPTSEELSNPPPTEVELRQERITKERRWRDDLAGWTIVKPTSPVVWDERFCQAIRFFTVPAFSEFSSFDN
ncbi:Mitochondrial import inner membrane translocase subunit TIM54 [Leucoagaricus sp. SymC.cos]|nr:Mitochondrial import inner membrane translocase subunit TIM54 [Leucoagaricus sp. SymC.cos]